MTPRRLVPLLVLALVLPASACGRYINAYAAVVNGDEISFDQLERAVVAARAGQQQQQQQGPAPIELQRQVLLQLIQRTLVTQLLSKEKISVTQADVDARLKQVRALFGSEQEFTQALSAQGLDASRLGERLLEQLKIERLQQRVSPVTVTEAEVAQRYRTGIAEFTRVHVRHILISSQRRTPAAALALAKETVAKIRAGEDFAALARRLSEDPGSKEKGGDLGTQVAAGYVAPFAKAATTLPPKRVSDPVRSEFGYHVIEVISRTVTPLAQVREQIRGELVAGKVREPFQRYIEQVVRTSTIEVNPRIGDLDPTTFQITDHRFFVPSSPEPEPPIPGGSPAPLFPGAQQPPVPAG